MKNAKQPTIKRYVSPLDSVLHSDADSSLGSVLSLVHSSHSAVFIFDNDDFLGLVSPFKTLYAHNHPYTTKVSSIAFKPPTITEKTPVYEVAEHMLATKIYMLPVFDEDGMIQGVIHGKSILRELVRDPDLVAFVSANVTPHTPITAPITSSVKDIFYDLKEKGVSRMIVVDAQGDLAGIVTRSDLMHTLIKPTPKMRFPKEGAHMGYYSLAGEKKFRKEEPIRRYYSALVDSLPDTTSMEKIVTRLITSDYNSIVLVNSRNKPTGFLSTRDLLQAVTMLRPEETIHFIVKKPSKAVSDEELKMAREHLGKFGRKLTKRMEIEKIEITSEEIKNANGKTRVFNTTLIVTPVAGRSFIVHTKHRHFVDGIQEATELIEKQRRRRGVVKEETRHTSV